MQDVHYYDGKLQDLVGIAREKALPIMEKRNNLSCLRQILANNGVKQSSLLVYDILVVDCGEARNFDNTNRVSAEDLLCYVYSYICSHSCKITGDVTCEANCEDEHMAHVNCPANLDESFYSNLCTQLEDMRLGMCSQGRCTRLLQIIASYCAL